MYCLSLIVKFLIKYSKNYMLSTEEQLKSKFKQALITAFGDEVADIDPMLVPASNPKFGDYQCNAAMGLAKAVGMNPR